MFLRKLIKDRDYPFPWTTGGTASAPSTSSIGSDRKRPHPNHTEILGVQPQKTNQVKTGTGLGSPRFQTFVAGCETLGCISLKLCRDANASAGKILHHAIGTLENLFKQEDPMIFKIGFTHDPVWRWENDIYGYSMAKEKWTTMLILHYSREPFTPAMLEAALIEKFNGTSS